MRSRVKSCTLNSCLQIHHRLLLILCWLIIVLVNIIDMDRIDLSFYAPYFCQFKCIVNYFVTLSSTVHEEHPDVLCKHIYIYIYIYICIDR